MDWGHSVIGQLLGTEYQVIYFFSALTWGIFLTMHLFSIPEQPLDKVSPAPDLSPPSALRLLGSHSNGYGALTKEPVSPVVPCVTDLRPRSFSALGEANSVTSSAKQPNKEVCIVIEGLRGCICFDAESIHSWQVEREYRLNLFILKLESNAAVKMRKCSLIVCSVKSSV